MRLMSRCPAGVPWGRRDPPDDAVERRRVAARDDRAQSPRIARPGAQCGQPGSARAGSAARSALLARRPASGWVSGIMMRQGGKRDSIGSGPRWPRATRANCPGAANHTHNETNVRHRGRRASGWHTVYRRGVGRCPVSVDGARTRLVSESPCPRRRRVVLLERQHVLRVDRGRRRDLACRPVTQPTDSEGHAHHATLEVWIETEVQECFPATARFGVGHRDDAQRALRSIDSPHVEHFYLRWYSLRAGRPCIVFDGRREYGMRMIVIAFTRDQLVNELPELREANGWTPVHCARAPVRWLCDPESADRTVLLGHPYIPFSIKYCCSASTDAP